MKLNVTCYRVELWTDPWPPVVQYKPSPLLFRCLFFPVNKTKLVYKMLKVSKTNTHSPRLVLNISDTVYYSSAGRGEERAVVR